MASGIQCLAAVVPLANHFLNPARWESELNQNNPLGIKGLIFCAITMEISIILIQTETCLMIKGFYVLKIGKMCHSSKKDPLLSVLSNFKSFANPIKKVPGVDWHVHLLI